MAPIELAREQSDLLYHLFINTQTKTLDDVCGQIATTLKERYGEEHISVRLQNMLTRTQQDSDRIAKHGLLLFALFQEPDVRSIFMGTGPDNPPRVPPEKFQYFVDTELPRASTNYSPAHSHPCAPLSRMRAGGTAFCN